MSEPSSQKVKLAIQALSLARPVEGPPGDDGQRSVWHLSAQGAELLSFVDSEGRVQRQELTLLGEHCVWTSGVGLRTGRVEQVDAARAEASAVHPDLVPVPERLLRAALALEDYQGEDRYILHIQRVLALARQSLALAGNAMPAPMSPPPMAAPARAPADVASVPAPLIPPSAITPEMQRRQGREGLTMLLVLAVGLVVGVALLFWLL
ncbi:hypothetical protein [Cystobacter ferrugineus]|uniref:Uncharacterized protein n=1 Tax=Cystobacter ferrugineus TaxID=83449 RepID=A0A1L9B1Q5_9BACT|nr:hypothetical protein [Cystobacter ferrugineus]OJH36146.1 hypothetical protein BON30_33810 [Cystobacter ferrugineus]